MTIDGWNLWVILALFLLLIIATNWRIGLLKKMLDQHKGRKH